MNTTFSRKTYGIVFLLLITIQISTLFRAFQEPGCTESISGPIGTTVIINCDSAQFMQDSQNFTRLLKAETDYQDRPLYALTARLIEKPIGILVKNSKTFTNSRGQNIEFFYSFYLAFLILHVGIIALSLAFLFIGLHKLLASTCSRPMQYSLMATLVSLIYLNDVSKAFFWTPHTQLFNIFIVSFSLYSWVLFKEKLTLKAEIAWFSSVSLLLFFYPLQVIVLAIPLFTNFRRYWKWIGITTLPYLIYPHILTTFGGLYSNTQTAKYGQFVWLFDLTSMRQISEKLYQLLGTFELQYVLFILCLVFLFFTSFARLTQRKHILIYFGFLATYFCFIFGMGAYFHRISTLFLVSIIAFLFLILSRISTSRILQGLLLVVFLVNSYQFFFTQGRLY
jgi:hypothetical protein